MKKNIATIMTIILICMFCCKVVFGAEVLTEVTVSHDMEINDICIKFSDDTVPNVPVQVLILKNDIKKSEVDFEVFNSGKAFVDLAQTGENGVFNKTYPIGNGLKSGTYVVYVETDNKNLLGYFSYINEDDAIIPLKLLKTAQKAEYDKILRENADALILDYEMYDIYKDDIIESLYENKNVISSGESYLIYYINGVVKGLMKSKAELCSEIIKKYSTYIGVDYGEYLSNPVNIREAVDLLAPKMNSEATDFSQLLKECLILAYINEAESAAALSNYILDIHEKLNLDMTDYNRISNEYNKVRVFASLLNKSYTSVAALKNDFEEIAQSIYKNQNKPQSSSGGGSGGGFGVYSGGSTADEINTATPQQPTGKFRDVSGHWAQQYIDTLVDMGAVSGYTDGLFYPDNMITRAEFTKILCEFLKIGEAGENIFEDVKEDDWYYTYVCRAFKNGFITGVSETEFAPNKKIKREDAATILQRVFKFEVSDEVEFGDSDNISDYAMKAVKALASNKIINGYEDGTIRPTSFLTRAEVSAILVRAAECAELQKEGN